MFMPDQPIGYVPERKAVALLSLAFYVVLYGMLALLLGSLPPDQPERALWPCFAALSACYGLGFFPLAADWFWGRWFAIGLGYSGLTMAGWGIFMSRSLDPLLLFYGFTHGLVALLLQGEKMAALYDAQPGWRERLHLDEAGAVRVRHTVTRAAASLPTLIMIALGPRETAVHLLPLALCGAGLYGVLRLRTWGLLALAGAAGTALGLGAEDLWHRAPLHLVGAPSWALGGLGLCAGALLLAATLPFARPLLRFAFKK